MKKRKIRISYKDEYGKLKKDYENLMEKLEVIKRSDKYIEINPFVEIKGLELLTKPLYLESEKNQFKDVKVEELNLISDNVNLGSGSLTLLGSMNIVGKKYMPKILKGMRRK